jgi:hypothetical protein
MRDGTAVGRDQIDFRRVDPDRVRGAEPRTKHAQTIQMTSQCRAVLPQCRYALHR